MSDNRDELGPESAPGNPEPSDGDGAMDATNAPGDATGAAAGAELDEEEGAGEQQPS